MNSEDFEIKRALDTYFRSQYELQNEMVRQLASIEQQQRALVAIFAASAKELSK